ncbi:MAG: hypothetical protein HYZ57_13130 [Acidobacteria bacterium]|nr:hypothetical protein [Acidobacteriota bacterium]
MSRFLGLFSAGVLALALTGCTETMGGTRSRTPSAVRVSGAPGEIPAGTTLEVRTNETITSSQASEGHTYSAQIASDVVGQNGDVLIPRGSPAELVVLDAKESSGVKGPGVELALRSVTVRGVNYLVTSEDVERETGLGKNPRTATMVGGGAALGTLIGAVAGGGKGAVIGAAVGAAAGAAAQVLTQGKEVRIPAETVLRFRLDQPLHLRRAG